MNMISGILSLRKIKYRFKIIKSQISSIIEDRYYFVKFKRYVDENKVIDRNSSFLRFIALNYRDLTAINVCKQIDTDSRSESLVNLLIDIKENNKLFTIKRFIREYPGWMKRNGIEDFKYFSNKNNTLLCKKKVQDDIDKLNQKIAGVKKIKSRRYGGLKKFRNKRGAHYSKGNPRIRATFKDLNDSVDFLERLIIKYELLINQAGMTTLLPSNIDEFLELDKIFISNDKSQKED